MSGATEATTERVSDSNSDTLAQNLTGRQVRSIDKSGKTGKTGKIIILLYLFINIIIIWRSMSIRTGI